ncbi:hypothetical protein KXJ72_17710 (plasmid) [Comamonas aquatica]|nr:hypothetical protein KXJ72_17710 [Comamonas aquatica]
MGLPMWQASFMPIFFFLVAALTIYGFASLPELLREVILTFGGFFIVCTVVSFVYLKFKSSVQRRFNISGPTSTASEEKQKKTTSTSPIKQDRQQVVRDAEDALISEDTFLRDF